MQLEGREETVEKTGQSGHVQCVAFNDAQNDGNVEDIEGGSGGGGGD